MRTRSQSRSLADLRAGSGSGTGIGSGSEGSMTRPRRRHLRVADLLAACAGSEAINDRGCTPASKNLSRCSWAVESGRPRKQSNSRLSGGQTEAATESEWRDWANLQIDLIEDIAGRLLSVDVSEYLRFRSACKPWRKYTDDPHSCGGGLDRRFRPRHWIAVPYCVSPSRRRLINVSTGVRAEVDHPELSSHNCFAVADGLLVLCHKTTSAIRLLNPLTGALTHFPPITALRATTLPVSAPLCAIKAFYYSSEPSREDTRIVLDALKVDVPDPSAIDGAGIDDSTSLPTLVLALRRRILRIVCAKPGDQHWVSVHYGEQKLSTYNCYGMISFHSLLSFGGHCFVTTQNSDVMVVDLCPQMAYTPRMVYLFREEVLSSKTTAFSYLVRSHDERMLMVRYLSTIDLAHDHYEPTEIFTSREDIPSCMELFEVDLATRQLIPLSGIGGNYAAFVGVSYTVMLSVDKFPKLAADAVYLNYFLQRWRRLSIYHFKDRRISPPRELVPDSLGRFFPCACHWELDDYLICDIERGRYLFNILNL